MADKVLQVRMSEEEHRRIKVAAAERGITIKQYVCGLPDKSATSQTETRQENLESLKQTIDNLNKASAINNIDELNEEERSHIVHEILDDVLNETGWKAIIGYYDKYKKAAYEPVDTDYEKLAYAALWNAHDHHINGTE
jgi:hypothetical protein